MIWSGLWGLLGAILSVPLLGIMKILLMRANHPITKYVVMMIRADPTVDEEAEQVLRWPAVVLLAKLHVKLS